MRATYSEKGGTGRRCWRQAGLAVLVGVVLTLGFAVDVRAAPEAASECGPAEPPMGGARDALGERNKDNGLRAQQRAIEELQRCIGDEKDAASRALSELSNLLNNLQMASPGNSDDDEMMSQLNELDDMIRKQQELRDRTFRQGQEQRRRNAQPGEQGQNQQGQGLGDLRQNQQALRDRLNKLLEELKKHGFGQNQQGQQGEQRRGQGQQQGQGQQGQGQQGQGDMDQLGRAGEAMGEAEGDLGNNDSDSAVDAQGRALDALRKGAQSLAQSMQQQMGQGPGRVGRFGRPRADQNTDPLGRPLRGREYGDDSTVKVPGEIDVQRARRIIEELRKRFGEIGRPQEELDYIERLLKNY
jgi:uncharacterized protein (TIGR02302 family)